MRLINQSVTLLKQENSLIGAYKLIELAGRTCYKSEDRITEDSYKKFIEMLQKNNHLSVAEHGTIYLSIKEQGVDRYWYKKYQDNPYSRVDFYYDSFGEIVIVVTTNLRVIWENNWEEDLQYYFIKPSFINQRISLRIVCDRGIGNELVRHRKFSFSQESSRFCNYSANKFGNELTFIKPVWLNENNDDYSTTVFLESLKQAEDNYFMLLDEGWKPEQARNVLPLALKTELVMTGFYTDWISFLELRNSVRAHPQMRELANMITEIINEITYG